MRKVTAALRRNLGVGMGEGSGGVTKRFAKVVAGLFGGVGPEEQLRREAGVAGPFFVREQFGPLSALGIRQATPDEMVDLMRDDVDEVRSMGEEVGIEDNFAARDETRREDFRAGSFAETELAAMGAQVLGKGDG